MKLEFDIGKLTEVANWNAQIDATGYPTSYRTVNGAEVNDKPIHGEAHWCEPVNDQRWIEVYLGDDHNIYVSIDVESAEKAEGMAALEREAMGAQEAEARSHNEAELRSAAMRETARHYGFGQGSQ